MDKKMTEWCKENCLAGRFIERHGCQRMTAKCENPDKEKFDKRQGRDDGSTKG